MKRKHLTLVLIGGLLLSAAITFFGSAAVWIFGRWCAKLLGWA